MINPYFRQIVPEKPEIRKLGTIACDVVEATPVVFHEKLYRLEYFREGYQNEKNVDDGPTYLHFVDVYTNRRTPAFALDHRYGTAFVDGEYMYVAATRRMKPEEADGRVDVYRSKDLETWEDWGGLNFPGLKTFNTAICRQGDDYYLLTEVNKPVVFTFRFAQSRDLKNWTLLPLEKHFQDVRYSGGPSMYTVPGDPHFYVLYVEEYPNYCFVNSIARSIDLENWEFSLLNPVLMYEPREDKKIANPFLTEHERERIRRAMDSNNSDMELCDFLSRTIIYYSWGNQRGNEYLAEAAYEGSVKELLQGFFSPLEEIKR